MTVGHRLDVPVIDCFAVHAKAMENGMELQELFSDGVHYTPAGYEVSSLCAPGPDYCSAYRPL